MKKNYILLVMIALIFSTSCEKDLEIAEWEEISIVYAIINIKDTVQYLRVNRVYLSEDDPYNYTQVNDSVNYPYDAFEVFLEEYRDGQLVGEPVEYEAIDRQKEPGLFSNESNCVYRTSTPINKECTYKLRVINRETGVEAWSEINVLGKVDIEDSFNWERAFYRVNYYAEPMTEYDGSLDPYDHDHYIVRFLYWEWKNDIKYLKYVDWLPTYDPLKNMADDDDTTHQMFEAYWKYLSEQIPVDPSVKRQARGVDYMLALPGPELQNYIVVNDQPTNPHFYPDYSNLHNGEGLFGCKYFWTYFGLQLKPKTIDTISWGRYLVNHRFRDSNGEWH